jgi:hypothetical protein
MWFDDEKQEAHAGEVDLTKSDWVPLNNQRLLTKAKTVIDLATGVTAGPAAAPASVCLYPPSTPNHKSTSSPPCCLCSRQHRPMNRPSAKHDRSPSHRRKPVSLAVDPQERLNPELVRKVRK